MQTGIHYSEGIPNLIAIGSAGSVKPVCRALWLFTYVYGRHPVVVASMRIAVCETWWRMRQKNEAKRPPALTCSNETTAVLMALPGLWRRDKSVINNVTRTFRAFGKEWRIGTRADYVGLCGTVLCSPERRKRGLCSQRLGRTAPARAGGGTGSVCKRA